LRVIHDPGRERLKVGLLDLDFTSPSTHIILGVENAHPTEKKGIIPPEVHGIEYISIVHYSGEFVTPLRGARCLERVERVAFNHALE